MSDPLSTTQFEDGDAGASPAKRLFVALLRCDSAEQRREYLAVHCPDAELRRRVEQLFAAREQQLAGPLDWWELAAGKKDARVSDDAGPQFELEPLVAVHEQVGPYRIEEKIGEGGMGAVYRASQDFPFPREVALKLVRPGMDSEEVLRRFEAERQALALMDHPHIARILDTGLSQSGRPYIAMELVDGEPIDEFCQQRNLTLPQRIGLIIDTCRAVQHAHRNGIIHRDLKPSNVLVATTDGKPVVKVIDFGVAKAIHQPLTTVTDSTLTTQVIGTPMYMSPEQAAMDGCPVDTRSDVYSMGVLLYKLITGETPFDATEFRDVGFDEVRRLIREKEPPRPSSRVSAGNAASPRDNGHGAHNGSLRMPVSSDLDWIVMRALEKSPERRYESAADLADDLQRHLDHLPVTACPPSLLYRSRLALRRHRIALTIAAAVSLSLLVATGAAVWGYLSVSRAWRQSLAREQRVNDLLEASRLQTAIRSFRRANLLQLKLDLQPLDELTRPSGDDPAPGSPSRGSFAALLRNAAEPQPLISFHQSAAINDVASSARGERAATASEDGSVHVYEVQRHAQTGDSIQLEASLLGRHLTPTKAVAVSPDGKTVVSGSDDGLIRFWDLAVQDSTGRWVAKTKSGVESITFSRDGERIAVGARYSEFLILAADGEELHRIENDHRHESMVFSHDGRQLFVPTRQDIGVWDTQSGERVGSIPSGNLNNVRQLCWAGPDRQWLIAADRFSQLISIIDPSESRVLRELALGGAYPQSLTALRNSAFVVATFADGRALLISILPGFEGKIAASVLASFRSHQQSGGRLTAAPLALRDEFLTAGADGMLRGWSWFRLKPVEVIHPSPRAHAGFLMGDDLVIYYNRTHNGDRPAKSLGRGRVQVAGTEQIPINVHLVSFVGEQLAAACGERQILLTSLRDGSTLATFDSPLDLHWVCSASPDARRLIAGSADQMAAFERGDDGRWQLKWTAACSHPRQLMFVNPDHSAVVVSADESLMEYDFNSGQLARTYPWRLEDAEAIAASQDGGRWLALATDSHQVLVVDRKTGATLVETPTASEVTVLSFDPANRVVVMGHRDETLRALHLPTAQDLGIVYRPLDVMGEPHRMQWSSSGHRLLVQYISSSGLKFVTLGVRSPPLAAANNTSD